MRTPRQTAVMPPAGGDGASIPKPAAQPGASLRPADYTDDDGAGEAPVAPSSVAPSEAIVVAEPIVEPPPASRSAPIVRTLPGENDMPENRLENRGKRPLPPVATRFKPGTSGNPGGRPKGLFNRYTRKHLLREVADGVRTIDEVIAAQVDRAITERDTQAAAFLRDNVDGKPSSQDDGGGVNVGLFVQWEVVGK